MYMYGGTEEGSSSLFDVPGVAICNLKYMHIHVYMFLNER